MKLCNIGIHNWSQWGEPKRYSRKIYGIFGRPDTTRIERWQERKCSDCGLMQEKQVEEVTI